jgi:putative spermidine/putrescine transport system permease protein
VTRAALPGASVAAPRRRSAGAVLGPRAGRLLRRLGRASSYAWLTLGLLFIYAPIIVVVGASFDPGHYVNTRAFLQFPPNGLSLRWYLSIEPSLWSSLWFSLKLGALVAVAALAVGVPAALGLVRGRFPGKTVIAALFRAPLQIPFIVSGVAFLQTYYAVASATGLALQGSFTGLFLGHLFVATPYAIGSVGVSLQRLNPNLEEAALSLGASRWRVMRRVTLPLIMPGIFGGVLYAFLISFTDVTLSVFLAGEDTTPFPVRIFTSVTTDMEPTVPAVSSLVFFGSLAMVYAMQRLLGMETLLRSGGNSG